MSTASTTVHKTKDRPVRFTRFSSIDGTTPVSGGTTAMSSNNNAVATVSLDPGNDRRALIHGVGEGTCDVSIGSVVPLVVTVIVGPAPDLTHFDLDGFDPEQ
jgi:hypothetical protein